MRVLMLSWEYPPHLVGGLGAHVAELVPALAAEGVEVTLVTPRWREGAAVERVNEHAVIHRIDPPVPQPSNYFADAQQTNLTMGEAAERLWQEGGGFDLVHAHDWLVGFAAEALKKRYKAALVATIHATERGRGRGALPDEMARAIDGAEWWLTYEAWRVIVTSHYMEQEVLTNFQLPADKIAVIPNGVNAQRFHPMSAAERAEFRSQWAAPDEQLVFYVGRIQHEKGVVGLVQVAEQLLARGERVKFVLAGTGSLLQSLRDYVAAQGLAARVLLTGYVTDQVRDRLFQIADVAVFPSLYEPFGIVALEAMAAHCPVIVSAVGGLGEVVENELTGIKVPPDHMEALASAIHYVLMDRVAAQERADRAFAVVCHEYSWEFVARETAKLYGQVIAARAGNVWE